MAVGPVFTPDAATPAAAPRQGRLSEAIVGQVHGKYYEATSRGNTYAGSNATKRSPLVAFATANAPITLFNPLGSGKRLALMKAGFGQGETGTLGTGSLFHTVYTLNGPVATQGGTVPTGTAITPSNMDLGQANASVATLLELATLHTTAPLGLYPFVNLSQVASGTIGGNHERCIDDVDGAIILEPGGGWGPQGISAAGSTPVGYFGVVWEEVQVG